MEWPHVYIDMVPQSWSPEMACWNIFLLCLVKSRSRAIFVSFFLRSSDLLAGNCYVHNCRLLRLGLADRPPTSGSLFENRAISWTRVFSSGRLVLCVCKISFDCEVGVVYAPANRFHVSCNFIEPRREVQAHYEMSSAEMSHGVEITLPKESNCSREICKKHCCFERQAC